jgi:hypothetical protein
LILDRVEDLELRALSVAPPSGDKPAVALQNVRCCFSQDGPTQTGTETFCKLTGEQTEHIRALANDFSEAIKAFELAPEVAKNALRQESNLVLSGCGLARI